MMCISTHTSTHHLSIDLCSTSLSMLEFLEDHTTSTLAHDESIARSTERTAGLFRLIVTGRESMHCIETTYATSADSSLSTTSYDGVGFTQTNEIEGIGKCIR